jgi:hypothetical protein
MKKFLYRLLKFLMPPFVLLGLVIGSFFIWDPFKILKDYDEFYNSFVGYNEDYVATERYLKRKLPYNSFIFGSSRAGSGFSAESWLKYLNKNDKAFSFAASNESIFGIRGKIMLIDKLNRSLDNAILVIDLDKTLKKYVNSYGHLYIKHPLVSGESRRSFIAEYLKDYIFTGFFIAYLDYKVFSIKRKYMNRFFVFEENENDIYSSFNMSKKDLLIQINEGKYYHDRKNIFYQRDSFEKKSEKIINSQGIKFLQDVNRIFRKNHTKFKIVISPLYDQVKINNVDLQILNEIFGKENVYDFSGKNFMTEPKNNYYENSHYRIKVGDEILKILYSNDSTNLSGRNIISIK